MRNTSKTGLILAAALAVLLVGAVGANAQVLEVKSGKVCINCAGGTASELLEVRATDGTGAFRVLDTGAVSAKSMFELVNPNGNQTIFRLNDGVAGVWDFKISAGGFQLNEVGDPVEMTVAASGAVSALSFTPTSTKTAKYGFEAIDAQTVLAKVIGMPISEWSYNEQTERHIGPFAEDFAATFGLDGGNTKGINLTDLGGVSLVAIQGLHEVIEERDAEITQLRERLQALEAAVGTLIAQ